MSAKSFKCVIKSLVDLQVSHFGNDRFAEAPTNLETQTSCIY